MNEFPFGDPDGSRADLADVMEGFVSFRGHPGWGGIATKADDRSVRVIVGKKGSGKTVYLRRLQVSTLGEESVFSQKIQSDIPTTAQILEFCELCQGEQVTEKWRELWRTALLGSLLSLFLYKGYFRQYVSNAVRSELKKKFESLLPTNEVVYSTYELIGYYISIIRTQNQFETFVRRGEWVELRQKLSDILKDVPPVFFHLDAVDEEFSHAPMEWHQCQKGLFYAVMRMLREQGALGSRFHVIICIRDIVFSSVLRSEHASRYRNAPHICKLNWDTPRISYFLERKIENLDDRYFDDPRQPRTVRNFLSIESIENRVRGIREDILAYIVRHTRFLPRDIVEMGNSLARAKLARLANGGLDQESWETVVRSIVAKNARSFAEEQLTICANQIASHDRPKFSARHDYHELYTAGQEYISSKASLIKSIIRKIGAEIFTRDNIQVVQTEQSIEKFNAADVFSILWQNGLIGCRFDNNDDRYFFFNLDERDDFLMPESAISYAFHSCIGDAVDIATQSEIPVVERPPT